MKPEVVTNLAALCRLSFTDEQRTLFAKEFESIIAYVSTITDIAGSTAAASHTPTQRNVFRDDVVTTQPCQYTDALLAEAPEREGDYLVVKKILSQPSA